MVCAMEPLRERGEDGVLDMTVIDHDLVIVEAEDGVAAEREPCVGSEVASPVARGAVVAEAVDLDGKTLADDTVERMTVHPHLLPHIDADRPHPLDEDGLGTGVRPAAYHPSKTVRGDAPPPDAYEGVQFHGAVAERGFPDGARLDRPAAARDLEQDA